MLIYDRGSQTTARGGKKMPTKIFMCPYNLVKILKHKLYYETCDS